MKIENTANDHISHRKIKDINLNSAINKSTPFSESDYLRLSPESQALYEENLSSFTEERPIVLVEIKPKPP